jgi:hypothetical protein
VRLAIKGSKLQLGRSRRGRSKAGVTDRLWEIGLVEAFEASRKRAA